MLTGQKSSFAIVKELNQIAIFRHFSNPQKIEVKMGILPTKDFKQF